MKSLMGVTFGALLLSGAAGAFAASMPGQPDPGTNARVITSMPSAAGHSEALPVFVNGTTVAVIAGPGTHRRQGNNPWDVDLSTQSGGR